MDRRLIACGALGLALLAGPAALRPVTAQSALPSHLWRDATAETIGETAGWTNKVEIADLNGDGWPDLLFANGGDYSTPGKPEFSQVFFNMGPGKKFEDRTQQVFGPTPALTRVIKARDFNGDGIVDIIVGTTYQTQSRLYLGTGGGAFTEVTSTNLPQIALSVGDIEVGDVDGDGDLDLVLADWGPGNNMTNAGGRTRLWLNDGTGHFSDATEKRMPATLIRFSWDLELVDVDNDYDLDIVVSCKRCPGGSLFKNDGTGTFTDDAGGLPQYTNNYDFEAMDLDGDGFLDLVTINDGEILGERSSNRREHVFRNDGTGRLRRRDGAVVAAGGQHRRRRQRRRISRLRLGRRRGFPDRIAERPEPAAHQRRQGTSDARQGRVRRPASAGHARAWRSPIWTATTGWTWSLPRARIRRPSRSACTSARASSRTPRRRSIAMVGAAKRAGSDALTVRARVHDRKSPSLATDWKRVSVDWTSAGKAISTPMRWYGEYLWSAQMPTEFTAATSYRVCATDAAGNTACSAGK